MKIKFAAAMSAPASAAATAASTASSATLLTSSISSTSTSSTFTPTFSIGELHRGGTQLSGLCSDLASINSCAYCMMRWCNIKQEKAYAQTSEWLQLYTTHKLNWPYQWSVSGCPLCLGILCHSSVYWETSLEPALRNSEADGGEWKYEIDKFTLNISEPVLTRIRHYATSSILRTKYSRLQAGQVDLKDAIKWQMSQMITARTGGTAQFVQTNQSSSCDFGFLLTYTSEVPDQEYSFIVSTLPKHEQASTKRAEGDFSLPASNNPSTPAYLQDKVTAGGFRKRGKKNPRSDIMGQRTVIEALPKVKPEMWKTLGIFKPWQRKEKEEEEKKMNDVAANANDSASATPAAASSSTSAAMDTTTDSSSSSSITAASLLSRNIHLPLNYPLPLTTLVPVPTLLLVAHRESVLISGHYRKLYRCLSQSVWHLGDQKMIGAGSNKIKADAKAQSKQGADTSSGAAASSSSAAAATEEQQDEREREQDDEDAEEQPNDEEEDDGDDDDLVARRMTDSSVEEEIVRRLLIHFQALEYKFHSSGREDMDVRMLGNGRQFFIEFLEAKKVPKDPNFYTLLQPEINLHSPYVEVLNLHLSNKAEFAEMKKNVTLKRKTYRCVCWIKAKLSGPEDERLLRLNAIKDMKVQQKTPIRVLHRRSLLTRPKVIYSARTEYVNAHWFYLDLVTSSGTYVKEFVHGDRGRTLPNVCTITESRAEIIQLDVIGFDSLDSL